MGVANDHSIAWGIAQLLASHGAEMAFTYQGDALLRRVKPLAESLNAPLILPCDVTNDNDLDQLLSTLEREWQTLDFVVHAIAWSGKDQLQGAYINTDRDSFLKTMDISCYSLTAIAQRIAPLMTGETGGGIITLSYGGSERVMPSYNVMGVAKAALESSVRYLAADLGPQGVRINAISAGPVRTLSGAAVAGARRVAKWSQRHAALPDVTIEPDHVAGAALYLLSDLSTRVTGEVLYVDAGYRTMGMPRGDSLATLTDDA